MKPLTPETLFGAWAPVLLPINPDDTIDWSRLQDQLEILATSGISGIYTNGTTGEFWSQTEDEFDRISRMTAATCERAGLDWNRARRWLDDDDWRTRAEANRTAMMAAGSWGVPSYRLDEEHTIWGQDRFGVLEALLQQEETTT